MQVLIVDDNPLIRDLMCRGMESHCAVISASDGADALLKVRRQSSRPDHFRFPHAGPRRAAAFRKIARPRSTRNIPFVFVASRGDIEEKLRPAVGGGVEDFIPKPFFVADLVRQAKKIVDRLHLEKMQKHASRPGRDPGTPRGNERHRADAVARNGAEILPADAAPRRGRGANYISPPASASTRVWAARKAMRSCIK